MVVGGEGDGSKRGDWRQALLCLRRCCGSSGVNRRNIVKGPLSDDDDTWRRRRRTPPPQTPERNSRHRLNKERREINGRLIETVTTMPVSDSSSYGFNYTETISQRSSSPNEVQSDNRSAVVVVVGGAVANARSPLPLLKKDNRRPTTEATTQRKTNNSMQLLQPTTTATQKATDPRIHLDLQYLTQASKMLETSHLWSFNIFKLNYLTNGRSLFHITLHLFQRCDFIRTFQLDVSRLMRCLNLIESSYYFSNPYHNSVHAADVVQAMFVHLTEPRLESSLKPLEKMAAILAAACHDVEHPGTNQGFLVATDNPLCSLYDNQSVLENHHWRSTIAILQESRLFEHLDEANWLKMKCLIRKMILATDISKQTAILAVFRDHLKDDYLNLSSEEEHRSFILQITLKCADISNPCRPWQLSKCWSELICEEFFHQGDLEQRLGLPVTPFCDRAQATIAKIQAGFMSHVAEPLFVEWNRFLSTSNSKTMIDNLRTNRNHWESMDQQQQQQRQQQQHGDCALSSETTTIPSVEEVEDHVVSETTKRTEYARDSRKLRTAEDSDEDQSSRTLLLEKSSAKDACQHVRRLSLPPVRDCCGHRQNFYSLLTKLAPVFEDVSSSEETKKTSNCCVTRYSIEDTNLSSVLRINRINGLDSQKDKGFNDPVKQQPQQLRCHGATRGRRLFPADVSDRRRLARKMSLIVPRDQHAVAVIVGRRRSRSLATATLTCSHHLMGSLSKGDLVPQQWSVTHPGLGLRTSQSQKNEENLFTAKILLPRHNSEGNCFQTEGRQVFSSSNGLCHVTAAPAPQLLARQRPVLISRVLEMKNLCASTKGGASRTKTPSVSPSEDPEAVPLLLSDADRIWLNEI